MKNNPKLPDFSRMSDKELEDFWDTHEPEDFSGWEEGDVSFIRPPKKTIQVKLDPVEVRIIDKESKRTGINRSQLVRSWIKEKIQIISEN